MTNTTTQTAEALRAEAAQHDRDAHDSFERCDTDGFASQAASSLMGQLKRTQAQIAEQGGRCTFVRTRLVTLDGEPTDARLVNTRYGRKWRLDSTDEWAPYMPERESTLARKGYREVDEFETAPAQAVHWAPPGARGFSGMASVRTIVVRTDKSGRERDEWRLDSLTPDAHLEA